MSGSLCVVGLGPGAPEHLTPAARAAIEAADAVMGYKAYIELARPLLRAGQEILASGMTKELARAAQAIELALAGRRVALISSGDPGVYAMAAVVYEEARNRGLTFGSGPGQLDLNVLPGVPAVTAAAALLGAPLAHDFACISLSDRLTPWELIEKRLNAAAGADFVIALYNPKSKGRDWQLAKALAIIGRHRAPATPLGVVKNAMRPDQLVSLTSLGGFLPATVDMHCLLIVGNSQSFVHAGRMVTPRGYLGKYGQDWAGGE
ncbi:MAG: precorrin-3B C(17)-methyltransferase [Thermodesulfobacteriota bacterium]